MRELPRFLNLLSQHCAALPNRLRLGIVARLILSFAGVAVLILAANMVIQQGILVESTTRVMTLAALPTPVKPAPAPPPVVAPPLEAPQGPDRAAIHAAVESALGALTRFEQASQTRVRNESGPIDTEYKQTAANLTVSLRPLVGKPDGLLTGHCRDAHQRGSQILHGAGRGAHGRRGFAPRDRSHPQCLAREPERSRQEFALGGLEDLRPCGSHASH